MLYLDSLTNKVQSVCIQTKNGQSLNSLVKVQFVNGLANKVQSLHSLANKVEKVDSLDKKNAVFK